MATAIVLAIGSFASCHDSSSSFGPLPVSPVGRYELIGCTYMSDTVAADIIPRCSTGGSSVTHWNSATLSLNDDSTVTRTIVATTVSAPYEPMQFSVTDTEVLVGHWSRDGRMVIARWTNRANRNTFYARIDWDQVREGDPGTSAMYVWYRRTR